MEKTKKIVTINLIILVLLMSLMFFPSLSTRGGGHNELGFAIGAMFVIGVQVLVNLIAAGYNWFKNKKELGKAYLLSMFIVLIIGFSACFGGASLL